MAILKVWAEQKPKGGVTVQWAWSGLGGRTKEGLGSKTTHFNPTQIIANTYIALCARHYSSHFTSISQLNPRKHPGRYVLLLSPFFKRGNGGRGWAICPHCEEAAKLGFELRRTRPRVQVLKRRSPPAPKKSLVSGPHSSGPETAWPAGSRGQPRRAGQGAAARAPPRAGSGGAGPGSTPGPEAPPAAAMSSFGPG